MKPQTIAAFFMICALTHQASAELEAVWGGKLLERDYSNEELGLSLTITERPIEQRRGSVWGSGKQEVSEKDGEQIVTWIRESDERTIRCILPLDEAVIWRLIRESAEPPEFRFLAITNLDRLAVSNTTKAKMLEESTKIKDAWVRGYAWHRVFWFPERSMVANFFPQAIKDPCLSIAHESLPEICKHFDLHNKDGSAIKITMMWRGLPTAMYRVFHQEVEVVAERLHDKDTALMSSVDLERIRAARIPPDQWFQRKLGIDRPADVSGYLQPYEKKKPNKSEMATPRKPSD